MNLASLICLFKKIKIDSSIKRLWNAISWEIEDSYEYLRHEAEVFTSREYDNVEVEE